MMLSQKWNLGFWSAVSEVTKRGELVIYCATLMAPIAYAVLRDPPIRYKGAFSLFCICLIVSCPVVYCIGYLDGFSSGLIFYSLITFICSVVVFFLLLLVDHYMKSSASPLQMQQKNNRDSLAEYKKHRGVV